MNGVSVSPLSSAGDAKGNNDAEPRSSSRKYSCDTRSSNEFDRGVPVTAHLLIFVSSTAISGPPVLHIWASSVIMRHHSTCNKGDANFSSPRSFCSVSKFINTTSCSARSLAQMPAPFPPRVSAGPS